MPPPTDQPSSAKVNDKKKYRRFGRLPQETLTCNLGEVLDLSGGGMRIGCKRLPEPGVQTIEIADHPMPQPLQGVVVWEKQMGRKRHEVGIKFEPLTPEQAAILAAISRDNRLRRCI